MGISSKFNVHAEVEGDYTLAELLDLLGSPKKTKDALADLENATKKSTTALKALENAESQRQANIKRDTAERDKLEAEFMEAQAKAEEAQRKLVNAKSKKRDDLKAREDDLNDRQNAFDLFESAARVMKQEYEKGLEDLAADRAVFEETVAKAQKEIAKDMKAAEKYRQQALQIRREADDKVEAMKKALA